MKKTYFDEITTVNPHFIIAGYTDDLCCNDSLQLTSCEYELHRHLRDNGYEAVVFYDDTLKIYCYDAESMAIISGNTPVVSFASDTSSVNLSEDGPLGAVWMQEEEPSAPDVTSNGRYCLNNMDVEMAWAQIRGVLQSERKIAVCISNMNAMAGENFPQQALKALTELGASRNKNGSIAVYIMRGLDFASLDTQIRGATDEWERFMNACIRPIICEMKSNAKNFSRIFRVGVPNQAEIRNLLLYFNSRDEAPLFIKYYDVESCAKKLAYACACENIVLKELVERLNKMIRENPRKYLSPDNCGSLFDKKNSCDSVLDALDKLVGMKEAKQRLKALYDLRSEEEETPELSSRFAPKRAARNIGLGLNVAILGEKGVGKSELAGLLGKVFFEAGVLPTAHVEFLRPSDVIRSGIGESGIAMKEAIQRAMGGVLFIDEAYVLSEKNSGSAGAEAVAQIIGDMTAYKGMFSVVLAGYEPDIRELIADNEGFKSRFLEEHFIVLKPYEWDEIRDIFLVLAEKESRKISIAPDADSAENWVDNFFENWVSDRDREWGNAREAEKLLNQMLQNYATRTRNDNPSDKCVLTPEDIPERLRIYLNPRCHDLDEAIEMLKAQIGLGPARRFLIDLCGGIRWDKKLNEPGCYVFAGPPGTGKTYFAEIMCTVLNLMHVIRRRRPIIINAGDLVAERCGGTPGKITIAEAINMARGGMLFIDEFHQLKDTEEGKAIIRQLVPYVGNEEIRADTCVVLAGYTDEMTEALNVDAGLKSRFDKTNRIPFVNYTASELVKLLELFLKNMGYEPSKDYLTRSQIALSKYLDTVENNFGNARYIKKEYINLSLKRKTKRLNMENLTHLPEEEREYAVPDEKTVEGVKDTNVFTAMDIPECFEGYAGPVGIPVIKERNAEARTNELIGKRNVKEYIDAFKRSRGTPEFCDSVSCSGKHFVISGPIGSGRHTVARTLASHLYEASMLDNERPISKSKGAFEGKFVGHTIPKTLDVLNGAQGNMLIVENPSSMLPRNSNDNTFGTEALSTIVGAMGAMNDISIVFIDTPEGVDALVSSVSGIREKAVFLELDDLAPIEMEQLFRQNTEQSICFDGEVEELIPSFFLNWVSDRGGLGEKSKTWANGSELEPLIESLRNNWERLCGERVKGNDGITRRMITKEMFPKELHKYLVPTMVLKKNALSEFENMVGLAKAKDAISKIERRIRHSDKNTVQPGCYCFIGHPGVGKTTVARIMGGVLAATGALEQGHVVERNASVFVKDPDLFDTALKLARHGILFIDEAHGLLRSAAGQEVIRRLVTALEDNNVLNVTSIILAGYPQEMEELLKFDPGLNRRFGKESSRVYFENYTAEELAQILEGFAENAAKNPMIGVPRKITLTDEYKSAALKVFQSVIALGDPTYGNAGFVRNFLNDSIDAYYERNDGKEELDYTFTSDDIPERYKKAQTAVVHPSKINKSAVSTVRIDAPTEKEMRERSSLMTVYITSYKNGQPMGEGSGVIVTRDGHVLTCHHVIDGADAVKAKIYCPHNIGPDTLTLDCEILQPWSREHDMALLKLPGSNFVNAPVFDGEEISEGQAVMLAGFPSGALLAGGDRESIKVSHKFGRISSVQKNVNAYYVDISAYHGDSGGPVFSMDNGCVIGILRGAVAPKDAPNDESNLFVPIHSFWKLFTE